MVASNGWTKGFGTVTEPRRRPAWPGELAVVVGLLVVYDQVAGLARVRTVAALAHGRALLTVEHFDIEQRLDHLLDGIGWLHAPAAYYYDIAHIAVTTAVLVGAYLLRPTAYRRARTALVTINLVGLAVFLAYPLAPPRLLPDAGFVDIVAQSHTWGAWETAGGVAQRANEYGSMPSLHVAWAVWVALTVASMTTSRAWRAAAWAHVGLTSVVVIATGNHYLLDVLAGALTCGVGWAVAVVRRTEVPAPVDEPVLQTTS